MKPKTAGILLACLALAALQYPLWFADDGLIGLYRVKQEVAEQERRNAELRERNRRLAAEVESLREGDEEIERRARSELGMIGPREKMVLLVEEEVRSAGFRALRPSRRPAGVGGCVRVLLSNDDGYRAEGLQALERALLGHADIMIVAPERNHSGASNSLTLFEPLRVTQLGRNRWYCSGTPTDCVHIAITGLLPEDPDMVFSGINHGPNLGR